MVGQASSSHVGTSCGVATEAFSFEGEGADSDDDEDLANDDNDDLPHDEDDDAMRMRIALRIVRCLQAATSRL